MFTIPPIQPATYQAPVGQEEPVLATLRVQGVTHILMPLGEIHQEKLQRFPLAVLGDAFVSRHLTPVSQAERAVLDAVSG